MQALILAGGEGTRLRPLTINTPKPIVPIGNLPFLVRQILSLKAAGIENITLSLNYQPTAITKVIGDGHQYGVNLRYVVEPVPMGTAGAYKFAQNNLREPTLVLNGDILTDLDLLSVINQHKNLEADATIVLTRVENPSMYGLVQFDKGFRVLNFLEKPKIEEIHDLGIDTINAGIYVFEPFILDYIPADQKYSFEYQLFPELLNRKAKFNAFVANDNYWIDIGTPERYLKANLDLIDGKIKCPITNTGHNPNIINSAEIDNSSIVGDNSSISLGAKISRSIIGDNVILEADALVKNSVIWSGTKIGSKARIVDSIIGYNSRIGENVQLERNSVLGDKTVIANTKKEI